MEFWVNVYDADHMGSMAYSDRSKADRASRANFTKTIKVREVTE